MQLTDTEKSIITEILRVIGRDEYLNEQFAEANGMEVDDFNDITDDLFRKLVKDTKESSWRSHLILIFSLR